MSWLIAKKFAALNDEVDNHRSVVACARAYAEGVSSAHPILRRDQRLDQHKRQYRYRWDPDAEWRGRHLAQLVTHPDWSSDRLADELGVTYPTLRRIMHQDRWIARPLQPTVAELYGADPGEDMRQWWAVCDKVLDRLVVSSTHEELSAARRAKDKLRSGSTCRGVIVRGTGQPPEVGLRVRRERLEAVGVGS